MARPRIVIDPETFQPVIFETQVAVANVLRLLAGGYTIEQLAKYYPDLSAEAVIAAIRYAIAVLDVLHNDRNTAIHVAAELRLAEMDFDQTPPKADEGPKPSMELPMGFMGLMKPK